MMSLQRGTEQKDHTRERLIAAGLALLATKGYRAATTREISLSAGVTEVTMYRHFRSKDELFAEAIREYRQKLLDLIPEPSGDLRRDLQTLVTHFYEHITKSPVKIIQITPELKRHCEVAKAEIETLHVELNQRLRALFRHYQYTGQLTREVGDHIVAAFTGPIYYYSAQGFRDQHQFMESEKYVELFLRGFGVPS